MNREDINTFANFVELMLKKQFDGKIVRAGVGDIARATTRAVEAIQCYNFTVESSVENTIISTVARNIGLVK